MDYEILDSAFMFFVGLVTCLVIFGIGVAIGEATKINELEYDCIVYNNKVYCEVSNIEKGE